MDVEVKKKSTENKYLPLLYDGMNEDTLAESEKVLSETEDNRRKGLCDLRDFIKNSNLRNELEDELLLAVLRVTKYDAKKSRDKLSRYCCLRRRRKFPQPLDKILLIIDRNILGILPYRDSEGAAILYGRIGLWHPDLCSEDDVGNCMFALLLFTLSLPLTTVSGVRFMGDAQTDYPSHLFILFSYCRKHVWDLMAIPMKIKAIHALNVNSFFRFGYAVIKPFLPHKIQSRVHMHKEGIIIPGDLCPPSLLPNEFGGTMGPLSNDHFRDQFVQYLMKLKEEESIYSKKLF